MWTGMSGLITLAVLIIKAWIDHASALQKEHDDAIKNISNAVASGDISRINAVVSQLRR